MRRLWLTSHPPLQEGVGEYFYVCMCVCLRVWVCAHKFCSEEMAAITFTNHTRRSPLLQPSIQTHANHLWHLLMLMEIPSTHSNKRSGIPSRGSQSLFQARRPSQEPTCTNATAQNNLNVFNRVNVNTQQDGNFTFQTQTDCFKNMK